MPKEFTVHCVVGKTNRNEYKINDLHIMAQSLRMFAQKGIEICMDAPTPQKNIFGSVVSLKGVIIPVKWDSDGKVAAIAIATTDERQLLIDENAGTGKELRRCLRTAVKLTGVLRISCESEQSESIIEVQAYEPVKAKKNKRR